MLKSRRLSVLIISLIMLLNGCSSHEDDVTIKNPQVEEDKQVEEVKEEDIVCNFDYINAIKIPNFDGKTYNITINDNKPYFTKKEYTTKPYIKILGLNDKQQNQAVMACIQKDSIDTSQSKSVELNSVTPMGWASIEYGELVEGSYLYNRTHLLMRALGGPNTVENIITGTRYMNADKLDGMIYYENQVLNYVEGTGNHVLYRVTPIYNGDDIISTGVLMEASSVEDKGKELSFCVFIYNEQPNININHKTGDSKLISSLVFASAQEFIEEKEEPKQEETPTIKETVVVVTPPTNNQTNTDNANTNESTTATNTVTNQTTEQITPSSEPQPTQQPEPPAKQEEPVSSPAVTEPIPAPIVENKKDYVLNTNTKKFHYPDCASVRKMAAHNRTDTYDTYEHIISLGYSPCGNCHPIE